MTDITKRLAEAPLQWQEGVAGNCNIVTYNGEDVVGIGFVADPESRTRIIRKHNEVVAAFDRTAAQEANVQGGEVHAWVLLGPAGWDGYRELMLSDTDPSMHQQQRAIAPGFAWYPLAALHPAPAPASGEVFNILLGMRARLASYRDDGSVNREAGFWLMQEIGTALTIEAATRARQGEGGALTTKDREAFMDACDALDVSGYKEISNALHRVFNRLAQAGTVAAQGEAYRAVTEDDADAVAEHLSNVAIDEWPTRREIFDALKLFGFVIPTAAPVPAEHVHEWVDGVDDTGPPPHPHVHYKTCSICGEGRDR